jgi:phosphoadenosine phosphosulfate reductase
MGNRRASRDSPHEPTLRLVSWDATRKLIKIAPLAAWSDEDVARYIEINAS